MSPDIEKRIIKEYGPGSLNGILRVLRPAIDAALGDRVIRCVIVLAKGDVNELRHYVKQAVDDYRDVIYWAEYDGTGRMRDYNLPFD